MTRVRHFFLLLCANVAVALLCESAYRTWLYLTAPRADPTVQRFEIYGVGESTLVGEPYEPKLSVPLLLDHMFDHQLAGRPINIVNLAERAVPLYPQSLALEHALAARDGRAPGVVLVVSGHNEGIRPWNTGEDRLSGFNRLAEYSALARDMLVALRRRHVVAREQTLAAYEHYLRQVIDTAQRNGLVPIVATMASNITRVEPNFDNDDARVRASVKQGLDLEDRGQSIAARDFYLAELRQIDHAQAPLYYRAARCEEQLGEFAAAREHYWDAIDHDPRTTFGRATRAQNDLVRRLAREYDIPLVDTVAIFESHSPHGLMSADLFADGQHPSVAGYVLLAHAFADVLSQRFETRIVHPLRDGDEAVAALGLTEEDLRRARVDAGSWLIATSVNHPSPRDRMALATALFQDALGKGDDFSAWLGLGLAQAALRTGLYATDPISGSCHYTKAYGFSPAEVAMTAERMSALGTDAAIIDRVRVLGHAERVH